MGSQAALHGVTTHFVRNGTMWMWKRFQWKFQSVHTLPEPPSMLGLVSLSAISTTAWEKIDLPSRSTTVKLMWTQSSSSCQKDWLPFFTNRGYARWANLLPQVRFKLYWEGSSKSNSDLENNTHCNNTYSSFTPYGSKNARSCTTSNDVKSLNLNIRTTVLGKTLVPPKSVSTDYFPEARSHPWYLEKPRFSTEYLEIQAQQNTRQIMQFALNKHTGFCFGLGWVCFCFFLTLCFQRGLFSIWKLLLSLQSAEMWCTFLALNCTNKYILLGLWEGSTEFNRNYVSNKHECCLRCL